MNRDERFVDLATKAKFLTPAQIEECRKLRELLMQKSFALTMPEIVAKKEYLTPDQLRIINVAILFDEIRSDDEALGEFMIRKGCLPREKVNECLSAQETPFKEGRPFSRLDELLIEKGYITPQQMSEILRARAQPVPAREPEPLKPATSPRIRAAEGGLKLETFRVGFRRSRIQGETYAAVLDLEGSLDGHTATQFDEYLHTLTGAGFVHLVLTCGKLEYLSSAGIGVLAGVIKRCRDGKGDLRLCTVDDKMRRVMQIIGLLSLVRAYDDESGAVASFKYA